MSARPLAHEKLVLAEGALNDHPVEFPLHLVQFAFVVDELGHHIGHHLVARLARFGHQLDFVSFFAGDADIEIGYILNAVVEHLFRPYEKAERVGQDDAELVFRVVALYIE